MGVRKIHLLRSFFLSIAIFLSKIPVIFLEEASQTWATWRSGICDRSWRVSFSRSDHQISYVLHGRSSAEQLRRFCRSFVVRFKLLKLLINSVHSRKQVLLEEENQDREGNSEILTILKTDLKLMAEDQIEKVEEKAYEQVQSFPAPNESPRAPSPLRSDHAVVPLLRPSRAETLTATKDDLVSRLAASIDGDGSPGSIASMAGGSFNRDLILVKLNQEKTLSIIRAWEENAKARSNNRYNRKIAKIAAWEVANNARAEANLRSQEEKLEKERAEYVEKMKNKIAEVHRKAEEVRALAEARHGEEILKAEEKAAKYRASGKLPKKFPFCLSG